MDGTQKNSLRNESENVLSFISNTKNDNMAIKSSQKKDTPERVIDGKEAPEDQVNENILRPKRLAEYIGQEHLKRHLGVAIESATLRKTSLEHILLYGPP